MPFNEQQVLYEYEEDFCHRLRPVLRDLGVQRLVAPDRRGREAAQPHTWRVGDKAHDSDRRKETHVVFDGFFYNEDEPDVGKPVVQTLGEPRVIYSRIIDSDVDYLQTVDESTLTVVEEWTEEEFGVAFNVTNTTTAKAEASASVGGVGGSASVENTTTISLDTSFGQHTGGKSSRNDTLAIRGQFTVEAGQRILAYAEASKQQITTPYEVHGYIDHALKIDLYDWVEENAPYLRDGKDQKHNVLNFANLTDFRAFLQGYLVAEYPNMRNFLNKCSDGSRKFFNWLSEPKNRHRQFERQRIMVSEQATEVKVKFLD